MTEIEPFIHRKVVVLDQECSVAQAALVMRERGIGSVLVADHQGHIVGIVTDRDLAIRVLAQGQGQVLSLVSVMSHPVISVNERADVEDVIRLMAEKGCGESLSLRKPTLARERVKLKDVLDW